MFITGFLPQNRINNKTADTFTKSQSIKSNGLTPLYLQNLRFMTTPLQGPNCDVFVKSKEVSFKGIDFDESKELTEQISKIPSGKKKLLAINELYPNAQGITMGGGIPESWDPKDKKEEFFEGLGEIVTQDRHYADVDKLQERMDKLFKDCNVISDDQNLEVEYLGKGFFGRAYKVSIDGEDAKVLKIFKRTLRYQNNHGNYSEQNLAEYINRYAGDNTNAVKYYFGDTKNGYMVVDYLSDDVEPPKNNVVLSELGIDYDDAKPRNYKNGFIVDYGGMITISNLAEIKKRKISTE